MSLTVQEIEHIARLARLDLTEQQKTLYREQLSHILDYIAKLRELDTADVPPTAGGGLTQMPLRQDESRRKTPIVGHTTCRSERQDKKLWHQRRRTRERTALTSATPESLSAYLPLLENQVSSVWSMGKDGRSFWPVERQAATTDRIATHKGRSPQERTSLKQRLLRKWIAK